MGRHELGCIKGRRVPFDLPPRYAELNLEDRHGCD